MVALPVLTAGKTLAMYAFRRGSLTHLSRKWFIGKRGYATIKKSAGDYVWGVIWLIHSKDEASLDEKEGPKYDKHILSMEFSYGQNPKHISAAGVYIEHTTEGQMRPEYKERLKKARKDGIERGIPSDYFDKYWPDETKE